MHNKQKKKQIVQPLDTRTFVVGVVVVVVVFNVIVVIFFE